MVGVGEVVQGVWRKLCSAHLLRVSGRLRVCLSALLGFWVWAECQERGHEGLHGSFLLASPRSERFYISFIYERDISFVPRIHWLQLHGYIPLPTQMQGECGLISNAWTISSKTRVEAWVFDRKPCMCETRNGLILIQTIQNLLVKENTFLCWCLSLFILSGVEIHWEPLHVIIFNEEHYF